MRFEHKINDILLLALEENNRVRFSGTGNFSDMYDIKPYIIKGKEECLAITVSHQKEHYPWQPSDNAIETATYKIKIEKI